MSLHLVLRLSLLFAAICGVYREAAAAPFDTWAALASAAVTSPYVASGNDQGLGWTAPDGRAVSLTVRVPSAASSHNTVIMAPVPAGADARPYFDAALQMVRATGARALIIPQGTYVFQSLGANSWGHLVVQGLNNVTIDGQNSTLLFTQNAPGIYLTLSRLVKIQNLSVGYTLNMASLGTIEQQNGRNVLVVDPAYPVSAADSVFHLAQYNTASNTFVPGGTGIYTPPGSASAPVYVGNQIYMSPAFQGAAFVNKSFVIFHHWYGGAAILMEDSPGADQLEDIVLDNVAVNSGPGMGIVAYGIKRGLGIWNCRVEALPGSLVSTEYDAMHILIVGGDVSLIGNTIENQGDDAINLNGPVSPVIGQGGSGSSIILSTYSRFISRNDTLAFFDNLNNFLGTAKVVQAPVPLGGPNAQYHKVALNQTISGLTAGSVARDLALIDSRVALQGNVIQNCVCHGALIQTPNTIVSGNSFSNTTGNAAALLTSTGNFLQGVGAINVIFSGNTVSNTGTDSGVGSMGWSAVSLYGVNANVAVSAGPVNKYVSITDNAISGAMQGCITVASSEFVTVSGNSCTADSASVRNSPGIDVFDANNAVIEQNTRSGSTGPLVINPASTFDIQAQSNF